LSLNQWEPILTTAIIRALNAEQSAAEALSTSQEQINSLIAANLR